jgi:toxin ParE1/3/4
MANFRMAPKAFQDLEEAVRWYESRSSNAASRFCRAIDSALDNIVAHPRQFAQWNDGYRYFLLHQFPYYIIYRLDDDIVTITAIWHTSRGDIPIEEF